MSDSRNKSAISLIQNTNSQPFYWNHSLGNRLKSISLNVRVIPDNLKMSHNLEMVPRTMFCLLVYLRNMFENLGM